jgi:DNA-binding NarL/FixJ family response regulator
LRTLLEPLDETTNFIEADTLDEALEKCSQELIPDLILLELSAPGVEGNAGLRIMRQRLPAVPIVALSASRRRADVLAAIESGANGFIPRTASARVLLSALRLVLSGEIYVPSLLFADRGAADPAPEPVAGPSFQGDLASLTARQREVLLHLVEGRSNAEIARAMTIELNTAKNHIKAIFRTLGVRSRTEAVVEAVRLGLRPSGGMRL